MKPHHNTQWNLDITKGQETGKICSLYRGFVILRFFSIYFTITGLRKSFVISRTWLFRGSLYQGSTVYMYHRDKNQTNQNSDYALKCPQDDMILLYFL